jgi:metal-responsive CopG/Arc/MetJ family transcriptional regulator
MRTSVLLTQEMDAGLAKAVAESGYGPRGRSRWISEAVTQLLIDDPIMGSVGLGEDAMRFEQLRTVTFSEAAKVALDAAVRIVRGHDALLEHVRSSVIRAAIRNRINPKKRDNGQTRAQLCDGELRLSGRHAAKSTPGVLFRKSSVRR